MDLFDLLAIAAVPATIGVIYLVWRFNPARRLGRRAGTLVAAAVIVVLGAGAYLAHYGDCSLHSKFCTVAIANTRSEVGFTWESWKTAQFYVSTYPVGG